MVAKSSRRFFPKRLSPSLGASENKSKLIEGVVGDHLARAAYNLKPTDLFDVSDHIYYWQTSKGHEIDYMLKHENKAYAFDVCYQNRILNRLHSAKKIRQRMPDKQDPIQNRS